MRSLLIATLRLPAGAPGQVTLSVLFLPTGDPGVWSEAPFALPMVTFGAMVACAAAKDIVRRRSDVCVNINVCGGNDRFETSMSMNRDEKKNLKNKRAI